MRVNVNAFIAVILCTVLLGGLWLLKYRTISEDDVWNPDELYGTVGGSSYSTSNMSSGRSVSSGSSVSLPSSRTISHKASSVPYSPIASSPYSPIASSPYSPITSSPISYASSAAQFHSFGGGGAMSDAVGGSLRANPEAMPSAASLSMPSMPSYAMAARSQNTEMMQGEVAAVSVISSMANAYNMPLRSSFISQSANLYQIGASEVANSTRYSVTGRHNAPVTGGGLEAWLNGLGAGDGFLYVDGEGNRYYDMDLLQKAFEDAQKNSQFPGMTWEQFLDEFFDPSGRHNVPVGEPWILLLFVALLVVIQRRRLAKNACA
jgi:hypothetical protein